jgi:excisionase family DNA binding protein
MSTAPEPTAQWLLTDEAAEHARTSHDTIRRAARRGDLKAYRPGGGRAPLKIRLEDLEAWMCETPAEKIAALTDALPKDADGYTLASAVRDEEYRARVMLAEPDREPDWTFYRTRAEFLTQVSDPITGHTLCSYDLLPIYERYVAARHAGQDTATARRTSGYNDRIDPDFGWE